MAMFHKLQTTVSATPHQAGPLQLSVFPRPQKALISIPLSTFAISFTFTFGKNSSGQKNLNLNEIVRVLKKG